MFNKIKNSNNYLQMFNQIFFIILFLALFNFATDLSIHFWIDYKAELILINGLAYLALIFFLWSQTQIISRFFSSKLFAFWSILVNIELLTFFCIILLGIGFQQLFSNSYPFFFLLICFIFYFFSWCCCHFLLIYFYFFYFFK